ncbi:MAG: hypothetical protein E4H20_07895 [Spirochaetales bacterium]|nr:MAG: hypothetical protein E4H20_07895 [Spirochaetales bacterium]
MGRVELESVLDYILNRADQAELAVIAKACERRNSDRGRYAELGGLNPGALADHMAASVNDGLAASMDSIRNTVRGFVENLIRENAPDATEDDIEALLRHFVPEHGAPGGVASEGSARTEDVPGLPPEAIAVMLQEFLDFSLGAMLPSKQKELWDSMPNWQEQYWEAFSPELKAFVKARLEGRMDDDAFWKASLSLLGL